MVELVKQGLKGRSKVGKVHYPARIIANWSADVNFYSKGMTVKAGTFVPLRYIGKPVGGFDLENPENIHMRIVPRIKVLRNHFKHPGALSRLETYPGM